jgi:hypothetical protein
MTAAPGRANRLTRFRFSRQVLESRKTRYARGRNDANVKRTAMADSGKGEAKASRQDRLKLALRENLKRRKAQARERGGKGEVSSSGHQTSLHGEVGKRGE